jgi:hypothetical protein
MIQCIMWSRVPAYHDDFEGSHQRMCCVYKRLRPSSTHRYEARNMIAGDFVQHVIRLPCVRVTVAVLVVIRVRRQVFVQVLLNPRRWAFEFQRNHVRLQAAGGDKNNFRSSNKDANAPITNTEVRRVVKERELSIDASKETLNDDAEASQRMLYAISSTCSVALTQ